MYTSFVVLGRVNLEWRSQGATQERPVMSAQGTDECGGGYGASCSPAPTLWECCFGTVAAIRLSQVGTVQLHLSNSLCTHTIVHLHTHNLPLVCPYMCAAVHLPEYIPAYLPTCIPIYLAICAPAQLENRVPAHLCTYLIVCQCTCLPVNLHICLHVYLPT